MEKAAGEEAKTEKAADEATKKTYSDEAEALKKQYVVAKEKYDASDEKKAHETRMIAEYGEKKKGGKRKASGAKGGTGKKQKKPDEGPKKPKKGK